MANLLKIILKYVKDSYLLEQQGKLNSKQTMYRENK